MAYLPSTKFTERNLHYQFFHMVKPCLNQVVMKHYVVGWNSIAQLKSDYENCNNQTYYISRAVTVLTFL